MTVNVLLCFTSKKPSKKEQGRVQGQGQGQGNFELSIKIQNHQLMIKLILTSTDDNTN